MATPFVVAVLLAVPVGVAHLLVRRSERKKAQSAQSNDDSERGTQVNWHERYNETVNVSGLSCSSFCDCSALTSPLPPFFSPSVLSCPLTQVFWNNIMVSCHRLFICNEPPKNKTSTNSPFPISLPYSFGFSWFFRAPRLQRFRFSSARRYTRTRIWWSVNTSWSVHGVARTLKCGDLILGTVWPFSH